jgi:hypothetical protein
MNIQETARKTEVKVLLVFGVLTLTGYYMWLKKRKDSVFANAGGGSTCKTDIGCPKCEVKCPNKPKVCYNPNTSYLINPCKNPFLF